MPRINDSYKILVHMTQGERRRILRFMEGTGQRSFGNLLLRHALRAVDQWEKERGLQPFIPDEEAV